MAAPYKNMVTREVVQLEPADAEAGLKDGTLVAVHQSRPDQDAVAEDPEQAKHVPQSIGPGVRAFTSGGRPFVGDVSKPEPPKEPEFGGGTGVKVIGSGVISGGPHPSQLPAEPTPKPKNPLK